MDENIQNSLKRPVLHVLVVGFHHKKGCQVEYSYPPLSPNGCVDSNECPAGWKYLPTLALPDGSHNYDQDTVFFHLPGLNSPEETVFGISCFRQLPVEKLKNRTADITRGTVQKSVCVLSSVPLYGHIQVKMELITHAYFDEGDFTKVSLLKDTYHHLNDCLEQIEDLHSAPQLFVGLSARDLVLRLRHKALLLYKLVLLERKVLLFQSPVQPLCSAILALLSLHPGMMERGLYQSACVKPSRPMSPIPQFNETTKSYATKEEEKRVHEEPVDKAEGMGEAGDSVKEEVEELRKEPDTERDAMAGEECEIEDREEVRVDEEGRIDEEKLVNGSGGSEGSSEDVTCNGDVCNGSLPRDSSMDLLGDTSLQNTLASIAQMDADKCALPLQVFTDGYLCLPYLSLPYMDVLTDKNVRGYVLGATNVLFKQKKNLADVIVEVESGRVETTDMELKRALHLSTEDLRFGEFLVRQVSEMRHDNYLDGVGWEGGDEWIRTQFHAYTMCLLRTSLLAEGSKEVDQFNKWFMAAWQETNSYKKWLANPLSQNILEINPGHPFAGQLSVADMKLRLAHTMQTTEGGRKLNQAMVSTSRVVATTGRAVATDIGFKHMNFHLPFSVKNILGLGTFLKRINPLDVSKGGALSQAKGALSNWWSNLTTPQSPGDVPQNTIIPEEGRIEQGIEMVETQNPVQV